MPQNSAGNALSTPLESGDPEDGSESRFDVGAALRAQQALRWMRRHIKDDGDPVINRKSSKLEQAHIRDHWSDKRQCDACERWVFPWRLVFFKETEGAIRQELCESCHWRRLTMGESAQHEPLSE